MKKESNPKAPPLSCKPEPPPGPPSLTDMRYEANAAHNPYPEILKKQSALVEAAIVASMDRLFPGWTLEDIQERRPDGATIDTSSLDGKAIYFYKGVELFTTRVGGGIGKPFTFDIVFPTEGKPDES